MPTILEQVIEANAAYISGGPRYLPQEGDPFVIVSCIDSRLTDLLGPALGLPRRRALIVRSAGNQVAETNRDTLRSIATAVFLKNAKEVFIVGHTDCALSNFSASEVIESFRQAGIARTAFGQEDLRLWFGAFHDVRRNVLDSILQLRKSEILPPALKVHGLLMDSENGAIEVLLNGDVSPGFATLQTPVVAQEKVPELPAPENSASVAPVPPLPPPRKVPPKPPLSPSPVKITAEQHPKSATKEPRSMLEAAMVLREFVVKERKQNKFRGSLADIEELIKRERDPVRIIRALEKVAADYQNQYPSLPAALLIFKDFIQSKGPTSDTLMQWIRRVLD